MAQSNRAKILLAIIIVLFCMLFDRDLYPKSVVAFAILMAAGMYIKERRA